MYSVFFSRMHKEVALGKSFKRLNTKYRQVGTYLYWSFIRGRYLKNIAIREHKSEKPLALKRKCFSSLKLVYLKKKEHKRQMMSAVAHNRKFKMS